MFTHTTQERGTSSDEFGKLPPEGVLAYWSEISNLIETKASDWLELIDLVDIQKGAYLGILEVWLALNSDGRVAGFVVAQWEVYPKRKYYNILAIAGDGLDVYLKNGLQKIERYACMNGAYEIVLQGRFGWKKKLEKYGYHQTRVQLRKNVRIAWSN